MMNKILIEPIITKRFLKTLDFTFFDKTDYELYGECKHPLPLVAISTVKLLGKEFDVTVIIDGDECELYVDGYNEGAFEYCKNVKELN